MLTLAGMLSYGLAVTTLAFGVVRARIFDDTNPGPLLTAIGCATLGALTHWFPAWWKSGAIYRVTQSHVIVLRGPFHRAMERRDITFARIRWSTKSAHIGCLELVRAVPQGALRRKLTLKLEGIECPDGVWAIVRDAKVAATSGMGALSVSQRLDHGERILWSAKPRPTIRAYLPSGTRQWYMLLVAVGLIALTTFTTFKSIAILRRLALAGLSTSQIPFWALAVALGVGFLGVSLVTAYVTHTVFVNRARNLKNTRYFISNNRVLIQCGREELLLDRRNIIDIIGTPAGTGKTNLYLVLDGPRARALATGGAFGEAQDPTAELLPVFECVQDGEGALLALARRNSRPPLPHAA